MAKGLICGIMRSVLTCDSDRLWLSLLMASVTVLLLCAKDFLWSICPAVLCFCNSHRWAMDLIILLSSSDPLPLLAAWHLLESPAAALVLVLKFMNIHFYPDLCRSVSAACAWHLTASGDSLAITAALCCFCRPSFPGEDDSFNADNSDAEPEHLDEMLLDEALAVEDVADPELQQALRLSRLSFAEEQSPDEDDFDLAVRESLAQNEHAQRRNEDVQLLLFSLGNIKDRSGHSGSVTLDPIPGNGWCFFAACCHELGLDEVDYRILGCLSLTLLAMHKVEFSVFVGDDVEAEAQETAIRRDVISRVPIYSTCSDDLSAFDLYVLDKFEGVISGDLSTERRYADHLEMKVFLQECSLRMAVLNSAGDEHSMELPSQLPWSAATASSLQQGHFDLFLVHYSEGAYLHYDAVCFEDGNPWQVPAAVRSRVRDVLSACQTWASLMAQDYDLARALLLSALMHPADIDFFLIKFFFCCLLYTSPSPRDS